MATYVDSSALVKLVVREPESNALRRYLRNRGPLVSSALARAEVIRAVLPSGSEAIGRARDVLTRIDLVRINERILASAGMLHPPEVRTLDAIHLATAQELGRDLRALVTYDERMSGVARQLHVRVVAPR